MMRTFSFAILFLLLMTGAANSAWSQQRVAIAPQYPQRGDVVTVTYDPQSPTAVIPDSVSGVTLVFSYSNFYDVATRIPMHRQGHKWTTSFRLAGFATYATFYLESGELIDKPAADSHYAVTVYAGHQPVENGLLYKAYSLSAQKGKSPGLAAAQASLYQQELDLYPGNYEAKVRLLQYNMQHAPDAKTRETFRQQALQVIAQKFNNAPSDPGNLNKVTMGYLIIGENTRVDSIRQVVMKRFPGSEPGIEQLASNIRKEKDTATRIKLLEQALQKETPQNANAYTGIHEQLFQLYAAQRQTEKTLYHARKVASQRRNPWTAQTLKELATTLQSNRLAPDTARYYAKLALAQADSFPAGIIRYFPETGYIYPFVDDSTRQAVTRKAQANLLSLQGLIDLQQARLHEGARLTDSALVISPDNETLNNATLFYTQTGNQEKLKTLQQLREKILLDKARRQLISRPAPSLQAFVDMKGQPVPTAALKDKIILIDFWATWCGPCMQEMPYLQQLYEAYKDNPKVVFMVVNSGARNTLADAQGWYGHKKYTFPVYYNTDPDVGEKFRFNIIPATYIIDAKGNIRFSNIGFEGPEIAAKLKLQLELVESASF
ncbi:redoxin domain-containing protein [Chitinophaga sp. 22536]|uniref:redoxin domain-containing protein n=1 Tax=unclassified Chitinophaga TaxID=2619133 RepID=UPI003F8418A0